MRPVQRQADLTRAGRYEFMPSRHAADVGSHWLELQFFRNPMSWLFSSVTRVGATVTAFTQQKLTDATNQGAIFLPGC
jgi:hypothetical protein